MKMPMLATRRTAAGRRGGGAGSRARRPAGRSPAGRCRADGVVGEQGGPFCLSDLRWPAPATSVTVEPRRGTLRSPRWLTAHVLPRPRSLGASRRRGADGFRRLRCLPILGEQVSGPPASATRSSRIRSIETSTSSASSSPPSSGPGQAHLAQRGDLVQHLAEELLGLADEAVQRGRGEVEPPAALIRPSPNRRCSSACTTRPSRTVSVPSTGSRRSVPASVTTPDSSAVLRSSPSPRHIPPTVNTSRARLRAASAVIRVSNAEPRRRHAEHQHRSEHQGQQRHAPALSEQHPTTVASTGAAAIPAPPRPRPSPRARRGGCAFLRPPPAGAPGAGGPRASMSTATATRVEQRADVVRAADEVEQQRPPRRSADQVGDAGDERGAGRGGPTPPTQSPGGRPACGLRGGPRERGASAREHPAARLARATDPSRRASEDRGRRPRASAARRPGATGRPARRTTGRRAGRRGRRRRRRATRRPRPAAARDRPVAAGAVEHQRVAHDRADRVHPRRRDARQVGGPAVAVGGRRDRRVVERRRVAVGPPPVLRRGAAEEGVVGRPAVPRVCTYTSRTRRHHPVASPPGVTTGGRARRRRAGPGRPRRRPAPTPARRPRPPGGPSPARCARAGPARR